MTADAGEEGPLKPGQVIDGFRIVEKLGSGSFGTVYRVEREGLTFALKLAHGRAELPAERRSGPDRSLRELECLLALRHPNIARVWSHGRWPHPTQGQLYLVMDYVEGFTLAQWKELCAPTPHEALVLFEKLAEALAYSEERGVKHRDLKPANIMVRRHNAQPVIVDYGAADRPGAETLTDERLPPGTPRHTSPEADRFDREHRHDPHARYEYQVADEIYAFGVTLYDVLTVPRLHSAPEYQQVSSEVIPPKLAHRVNPRVPVVLSELTAQLLSRDPAQRPVSFEVVRRKLAELVPLQGEEWHGKPIDAPPQPPLERSVEPPPRPVARKRWSGKLALAAAAGLLTLVLGLSVWGLTRPREPEPLSAVEASAPPPRTSAVTPVPQPAAPLEAVNPPPAPLVSGAAQPPSPSKRGSTVKRAEEVEQSAPSVCTRREPPPADRPALLRQWCRCAGMALVFASACTGAQLRPSSGERCPDEALAAMTKRGMDHNFQLRYIALDETQPTPDQRVVFKDGPITSVLYKNDRGGFPKGTRLFGYVITDLKSETPGEPAWAIRWTRLQEPGKEAMPVCLAIADGYDDWGPGSQPGAVRAWSNRGASVVHRWPPPTERR